MAQSDLVVVGIDVAKDKADAYIRPLSEGRTFPNSSVGQRQLTAWLRRHKVGKAVMEASGGYERKGEASRHFSPPEAARRWLNQQMLIWASMRAN